METKILKGPEDVSGFPRTSVGQIYFDRIKSFEDKACFIEAETGDSITFNEILWKSVKMSSALRRLGLMKHDIVTIISATRIDYFVPYLACLYNGYTVNLLNIEFTAYEIERYLQQTKTKLVFTSLKALVKVQQVKSRCPCLDTIVLFGSSTDNVLDSERILTLGDEDVDNFVVEPVDPDTHIALMLCSSGTTGLPKAVQLTHTNLRMSLFQTGPNYMDIKRSDVMFYTLPINHVIHTLPMSSALIYGGTVVLSKRFEPDLFFSTIQKYKVNKMLVVPQLLNYMSRSSLANNYDLTTLTNIHCGSAGIHIDNIQKFLDRFPHCQFRQMYGLTESSGAIAINSGNGQYLESIGKVVENNEAIIRDFETGNMLGCDQTGELCFRGDSISVGYYGNETATRDAIDEDGWFKTGDVAYYNKDGYIFLIDRIKDIIKYKAYQVSPSEIQSVIMLNPDVEECAVIGVPDERSEELPFAYIVLKNGSKCSEKDIHNLVEDHLIYYKHLRGGIKFVDEIPKNNLGKIDRKLLKKIWDSEM
ncbi:PREDICTED: 4-coumarate--CoA ligase 1-like [Nicrophorus vespilloides]|uniref:4-coumarate--CoA ligase 1-like n=1 Tax=Nicrophorus vespilloides TaxID=110193 RepID=A0ABM1NIV4_NICVS|nr:PREDICTED: 4-coumarate--CoA ligase 1-like [Nicrophorus vespilloides]